MKLCSSADMVLMRVLVVHHWQSGAASMSSTLPKCMERTPELPSSSWLKTITWLFLVGVSVPLTVLAIPRPSLSVLRGYQSGGQTIEKLREWWSKVINNGTPMSLAMLAFPDAGDA